MLSPHRVAARIDKAAMLIFGLAALLVLGIHWGSFAGHFLSDDFGFPWGLYLADQRGEIARYVWDHTVITEPQAGNFYRPVGFATFALNYLVGGADPLGWRLFNFALHIVNGWLLYRLARRIADVQPHAAFAAACAGALFVAYPLAPEVSAWPVARFDALALAGMLVAIERHLASTGFDRARVASLVAFAFALGSKEPAMTTPAFLLLAGIFVTHAQAPMRRRIARALRDVVPALVVLGAYLLWRRYLFAGALVEVYAGSSPIDHLAPWELWNRLVAMRPIADAALGASYWPAAMLAVGAIAAWNGVEAWRRGAFARLWLFPFLGFAVSVGAVLPHFTGAPPNGEGARLFYLAGAWLALWLALPLACREASRWRTGIAYALLLAFAAGQAQAMVPWRKASQAMNALFVAIDVELAHGDAATHALAVVPDHWRSAPFLRNAQGAPVIPPYRADNVGTRISLFTPVAYAEWAGRIASGSVPWAPAQPAVPRLLCFDADTQRLVPLEVATTPDALADWTARWQSAIAASPCADEFAR